VSDEAREDQWGVRSIDKVQQGRKRTKFNAPLFATVRCKITLFAPECSAKVTAYRPTNQ